jgi:hypothetical protein
LPYCYNLEEVKLLSDLYKNTEKIYHIGMISVNSRRRLYICQCLSRLGLKVNIINKWGIDREKEMAKCHILLNVHFSDEYKIFEEIRCLRWWFAGVPIISENSLYMEKLDIYPYIIWSPYNNLINTVTDYFKNKIKYEKYQPTNEIIESIAENRKNTLIRNIDDLALKVNEK